MLRHLLRTVDEAYRGLLTRVKQTVTHRPLTFCRAPFLEHKMDNMVILYLSDWNYHDKYYEVPFAILEEFARRIPEDLGAAWNWFTGQVDYDGNGEHLIKVGRVDMRLEKFFLDWENPIESIKEWN